MSYATKFFKNLLLWFTLPSKVPEYILKPYARAELEFQNFTLFTDE